MEPQPPRPESPSPSGSPPAPGSSPVPGSPPAPGSPTPPTGRRRGGDASWVGGLVLITLGVLLLVGQTVPDLGRYVTLIVGLALLVLFVVTRQYGFLVPGCIVSGVGLGIVLASEFPGRDGGAYFLLSMGSGFLAIWAIGWLLRLPERHWWPLVPGGILTSIGAVTASGERPREIFDLAWPIVFVVVGVLIVIRSFRRARPG